jgi:hypothetical protein
MKYFDYDWDLEPNRILFDPELNIDKLGWRGGDYFKVVNVAGRAMMVKVGDLEKFIIDGAVTKNTGE